jgi:hypothetical protein
MDRSELVKLVDSLMETSALNTSWHFLSGDWKKFLETFAGKLLEKNKLGDPAHTINDELKEELIRYVFKSGLTPGWTPDPTPELIAANFDFMQAITIYTDVFREFDSLYADQIGFDPIRSWRQLNQLERNFLIAYGKRIAEKFQALRGKP